MRDLIEILAPKKGEAVVLMPVTRVLVESQSVIGNLTIFPPGSLEIVKTAAALLPRTSLVTYQSQITGFSTNLFDEFATVGFSAHVEWSKMQKHNHDDDITLLSQLSWVAERSFDLLRLQYCELAIPDTLPGPIGVWDISAPYNWCNNLLPRS
jgi:hypothetical protein